MLQGMIDPFSQVNSTRDSSGKEEAPRWREGIDPNSVLSRQCQHTIEQNAVHRKHIIRRENAHISPSRDQTWRQLGGCDNLVAYEAMAISGPLVFARFVELMDGLIDTPDNVNLLRQSSIITSHLKDDEVTRLFNGMSDSIEVNSDCELDEAIKEVNEFYNAAPNTKTHNMVERYVYGAWKVLAMVATILFFLLMALQTFCSACGCSSLVKKTN